MKKYITPEMDEIELQLLSVLCGSGDEPIYDGPGDPDDPSDQPD